jgi:hypothetical protein
MMCGGFERARNFYLFLRPGENRLDKRPQNPWEAINGCETGMSAVDDVMAQRRLLYIRDPLITVHGYIGPVVPTVYLLR